MSSSPRREPDPAYRGALVAALLGSFLVTVNVSTLNVAFPALEATFDRAGRSVLSWVITGYAIAFAALLVPAGRLADRSGRRRVLLAGLTVFGISSVLVGAAPSVGLLIAARVAQAVGGALVLPSSLGLLLAVTPAERRSSTVALWGAAGSLGIATGPSLGALVVEWAGWRWAFLLLPPLALAAGMATRATPADPASRDPSPRPDLVGSLLLVVATASLTLAVVEVRAWGWNSAGVLGAAAVSLITTPLFLRRSARHPSPVLPLELFRARSLSAASLAATAFSVGLGAVLLLNILFLTGVWGYSVLGAGLASTPAPLVVFLVTPWAGRLADRVGNRALAVPGCLVFAAGVVWYRLMVTESADYWVAWLPGNLAAGVGIGLTLALISAAAVRDVDPERYAVAGGIIQTGRQLGAALGVAVLVALIGEQPTMSDYRAAWLFIAGSALVAAVASAAIGSDRPEPAPFTPQPARPGQPDAR